MSKRLAGSGLFFPSHIASVLDLLISNPEHHLNSSNFLTNFWMEFRPLTKHDVSSASEISYAPFL